MEEWVLIKNLKPVCFESSPTRTKRLTHLSDPKHPISIVAEFLSSKICIIKTFLNNPILRLNDVKVFIAKVSGTQDS